MSPPLPNASRTTPILEMVVRTVFNTPPPTPHFHSNLRIPRKNNPHTGFLLFGGRPIMVFNRFFLHKLCLLIICENNGVHSCFPFPTAHNKNETLTDVAMRKIFNNTQYSIFNIQYSIFNIQYSIFNIQYSSYPPPPTMPTFLAHAVSSTASA